MSNKEKIAAIENSNSENKEPEIKETNENITDKKDEQSTDSLQPTDKLSQDELSKNASDTLIQLNNYERITPSGETLLKRVSFSLPKNKMTVLLGLSGDGKSTLMDGLAGLCGPSHTTYGEILVQNKEGQLEPRDVSNWFPRVNYVEQSVANYEKIPLYNALCSIAKCVGRNNSEVREYMKILRITKAKKVNYANLSGGEKRRAMIIAGLLLNKEFNIWDEPLTGLDSEMAGMVLNLLKKLGSTNLLTIHQPSEDLIKKFDNVLVMHMSTIVYSGELSNMKEYFTNQGIIFPSDKYYINYLMQMCAQNSNNPTDMENIQKFNQLANHIIDTPLGPLATSNVSLFKTLAFLRVSITNVLEIFKNSFYFDKGFKGSSIFISIMFSVVIFSIFILFNKKYIAILRGGTSSTNFVDTYAYEYPSIRLFNSLINIKNIITRTNHAVHADLDNLLKTIANISWINIITSFLNYILLFNLGIIMLLPSNIIGHDFYKLSISSIRNKNITPAEYIGALFLDILVKKVCPLFIMAVIIYWSIYFSTSEIFRSNITISHTESMIALFLHMLIGGMHALALNMAPIPLKLFGLITSVYMLWMCWTPYIIEYILMLFNRPYNFSFLQSMGVFTHLVSDDAIFSDLSTLLKPMAEKYPSFKILFKIFMKLVRILTLYSPMKCFNHILERLSLFHGNIYLPRNKINVLPETEQTIKTYLKGDMWIVIENTLKDIQQKRTKPHEMLDANTPINGESVASLAWSTCRFFVIPGTLLLLSGIYTYRQIHPKLRS